MATVSSLPSEILSLIFENAVWSDPFPEFAPGSFRKESSPLAFDTENMVEHFDPEFRLSIGLVSKKWKFVRDTSPRLWSRIEVIYDVPGKAPLDTLRWLVKRSGALPLDLRLSCTSSQRSFDGPSPTSFTSHLVLQGLSEVLGVLQHSIPRWRTLHVVARSRAEVYAALVIYRQPALKLQEITFSSPIVGSSIRVTEPVQSSMPALFSGKLPELQSLTLDPFASHIDIGLMTGLRSLRLLSGGTTMFNLLIALGANPELEELTLTNVDIADVAWPPPQDLFPFEEDDKIVLPNLNSLQLELDRRGMIALLSSLSTPALTSLSLRRGEEFDDLHFEVDEHGAIIEAHEIHSPSTSDILHVIAAERRAGRLPLRSFSLTYGSVWEVNANLGEMETDDELIELLRLLGSIETLEVQNFSHYYSTLLPALSAPPEGEAWICPRLTRLHINMCEGEGRGAVRRFVQSRVSHSSGISSNGVAEGLAKLDTFIVEAEGGKVVCGSDDVRWIREHIPRFYVDQSFIMPSRHNDFWTNDESTQL